MKKDDTRDKINENPKNDKRITALQRGRRVLTAALSEANRRVGLFEKGPSSEMHENIKKKYDLDDDGAKQRWEDYKQEAYRVREQVQGKLNDNEKELDSLKSGTVTLPEKKGGPDIKKGTPDQRGPRP